MKTAAATPSKAIARVKGLRGLVAEISITGEKPDLRELLTVEGQPDTLLEVNYFTDTTTAVCLILSNSSQVRRGVSLVSTKQYISVPVGQVCHGRVYNTMGLTIAEGPAD